MENVFIFEFKISQKFPPLLSTVFGSLDLDLRHTHEPQVLTRPNFHTSLIREFTVVELKQCLD